ncbi:hypothetical protein BG005_001270 [Podila minutissima]|nr:hypothetical protein BG005_001270 [Podila minutissima]
MSEGLPIVVFGYDKHVNWDKDMFSEEGTAKQFNRYVANKKKVEGRTEKKRMIYVREQGKNGGDVLMEFDVFQKMIKETGCRFYGKDLHCSKPWRDRVMDMIVSPFLAYRGTDDLNKDFKDDGRKVSSENLMAYIGGGGTWTGAHCDHGGAIGHNLMISADEGSSYSEIGLE